MKAAPHRDDLGCYSNSNSIHADIAMGLLSEWWSLESYQWLIWWSYWSFRPIATSYQAWDTVKFRGWKFARFLHIKHRPTLVPRPSDFGGGGGGGGEEEGLRTRLTSLIQSGGKGPVWWTGLVQASILTETRCLYTDALVFGWAWFIRQIFFLSEIWQNHEIFNRRAKLICPKCIYCGLTHSILLC
jgi:hypothetical protein